MSKKRPDKKPLGLSVYMGMAKYASPLTERRAQRAISKGQEDPDRIGERHGTASLPRPEGMLIWLHAANLGKSLPLMDLIEGMAALVPSAVFLLTTSERVPETVIAARLPERAVHQYLPYDTPQASESFLRHWQPDLCLWSENQLTPVLLQETADLKIPMVYLNAAITKRTFKGLRWVSGVAGAILNRFETVFAVDEAAAEALRKQGTDAARITVSGVLQGGSNPLPVKEPMRSLVSKQLYGRPVWLASHVTKAEEDIVIQAQKIAQRLAHRLVLILSPMEGSQIEGLEAKLRQSGLNVARRSDPSSLTEHTDVLLADVPLELGLWYRVASVSLIGNSLVPTACGKNPGEAAALGSAIIHGSYVGNFADSYLRLAQAGAAIEVVSVDSLAEAVSELISPDKAAEMAFAGWVAISEGAEVTDIVMERITELLDQRGANP